MPNTRIFLLLAIATVGMLLWQQWQLDYGPQPQAETEVPATGSGDAVAPVSDGTDDELPSLSNSDADDSLPATPQLPPSESQAPQQETVLVTTDVLEVEISTRGGNVVRATLLDYPVELEQPDVKVTLLNPKNSHFFIAQTGLQSTGPELPSHQSVFEAEQSEYNLNEGVDQLTVPLIWRGENGLTVIKRFQFTRGKFLIDISQELDNAGVGTINARQYAQFQRVRPPELDDTSYSNPERFSFNGPAVYTPQEKYERFDYEDVDDDGGQTRQAANGWVAMVQHHFVTAWLPPGEEQAELSTARRSSSTTRYLARVVSPMHAVAPGARYQYQQRLFVGPKLQDELDEMADGLELTVDYGIFTPFSKLLFWVLDLLHGLVGNWGWAIILLTILVKLAFYKLTEAQYRSMARMRKLQPRIASLKERCGDDKQRFNMAMMELYKKEKVNPLGGCLPVLVQIPVFLALYWVLLESVELRQAPFMLWIQDLSSPDPYFILPIINGLAMFMTTKLSPNPGADPMQQKIMMFMPLAFSVLLLFFQAGLVLYWTVNAVLSLAQQWYILQRIEKAG